MYCTVSQATKTLENLAKIGLLKTVQGKDDRDKEYCLEKALFPVLKDALEEVFGIDCVSKAIAGVKYYRTPKSIRTPTAVVKDKNSSEVEKNVKSNKS